MSHVTSRSCDGMWNMKHEEWCHKWCHMEKGYKHGKSYLNQGLRYIFRIIKAWRPCEWQKGINVIENKRIMRIKKRYSWIYLTGKWIPYISSFIQVSVICPFIGLYAALSHAFLLYLCHAMWLSHSTASWCHHSCLFHHCFTDWWHTLHGLSLHQTFALPLDVGIYSSSLY